MTSTTDCTTIPLGLYIWQRIRQCGIRKIFGVPGDFNLELLDYIYDVDGLEWIGSTNELNAAYTADGYARVKGGAGCFVTTHGVGELSALNGVAGSMAEHVKIIHIVGQSSRSMQEERLMIHHNIGDKPDHQIFNKAAAGFRCGAATLMSEDTAADEVDQVIEDCFFHAQPVTIHVPMDMVAVQVLAARLAVPLDITPLVDTDLLAQATDGILDTIASAKRPCILIDHLTRQFGAVTELNKLLEKLHIPVFTTPMGKGIVDEDHECFVGVYNGAISHEQVRQTFESCDQILVIGDLPSDCNTGGYSRKLSDATTIFINPHEVVMPSGAHLLLPMRIVMAELAREVDPARMLGIDVPTTRTSPANTSSSSAITQAWAWPRLASFIQSGDVLMCETGTASFGLCQTTLPAEVHWITQAYYGSIGYATPATFGAAMAQRELLHSQSAHTRTILVTGDGSLMLTVQEVGSMIKHGVAPVVFIINNSGYTIERAIHGAHKSYNDIVPFDYSCMLQFLGMPAHQARDSFHRAATREELEVILAKDSVCRPSCVQLVEIFMDKLDLPWALAQQLSRRGPAEVQVMQESGFNV